MKRNQAKKAAKNQPESDSSSEKSEESEENANKRSAGQNKQKESVVLSLEN